MKVNQKIWEAFINWVDQTKDPNEIKNYNFKQTTILFNEWKKQSDKSKLENQKQINRTKEYFDIYKQYEEKDNQNNAYTKEDLDEIEDINHKYIRYTYETSINDQDELGEEFDLMFEEENNNPPYDNPYGINEYDYENELSDEEIEKYLEFERQLFKKSMDKKAKKGQKIINPTQNSDEIQQDKEFKEKLKNFKFDPNQKIDSIINTNQDTETIRNIFKYVKKEFINPNISVNENNKAKTKNNHKQYKKENINLDDCLMMSYQSKAEDNKIRTIHIFYLPPENKVDKLRQIENEIKRMAVTIESKVNKDLEIYKNMDTKNFKFQNIFVNLIFENTIEELKKAGYRIVQVEETYT